METQTERCFITRDNNIITLYDIQKAAMIVFGNCPKENDIDQFIKNCLGIVGEMDPSIPPEQKIRIMLKYGEKVKAIRIFYQENPRLTLSQCRDEINRIEQEMKATKQTGGV